MQRSLSIWNKMDFFEILSLFHSVETRLHHGTDLPGNEFIVAKAELFRFGFFT